MDSREKKKRKKKKEKKGGESYNDKNKNLLFVSLSTRSCVFFPSAFSALRGRSHPGPAACQRPWRSPARGYVSAERKKNERKMKRKKTKKKKKKELRLKT